mgnify:CR=1 FL=1
MLPGWASQWRPGSRLRLSSRTVKESEWNTGGAAVGAVRRIRASKCPGRPGRGASARPAADHREVGKSAITPTRRSCLACAGRSGSVRTPSASRPERDRHSRIGRPCPASRTWRRDRATCVGRRAASRPCQRGRSRMGGSGRSNSWRLQAEPRFGSSLSSLAYRARPARQSA